MKDWKHKLQFIADDLKSRQDLKDEYAKHEPVQARHTEVTVHGNMDGAIKRLKRKTSPIFHEVYRRQSFKSKSQKRREKHSRAVWNQRKMDRENQSDE